jgi:hypothetical protein
MSIQECALYGELVLYLRDRAAELLSGEGNDVEIERTRLDTIIRDWFFAPQDDLHGCAPRELIWAEQMGKPNPIHLARLDEFFDDDCPICQAEYQHVQAAIEAGEEHGWQWYYDDGGFPLIARYDPEGWDERWAEEDAEMERWKAEETEGERRSTTAPDYEAPPIESLAVSPEEFLTRMRHPWLDPALHRAAQALADHVDCPLSTPFGLQHRRLTYDESLSLAVGLHGQGVDVEALIAHIDAWPYENVALDWLSEPEKNTALIIQAMEQEILPEDEGELARFRHHRDFILSLAQVAPPGARLWLQGWLEAVSHGAFAAPSHGEE